MEMFSNNLIIQILVYIENNLYKKISIDDLSITFHYNKDYIMRLFKKEIGYTIIDYINHKRIYNSLISFKYKNISILNISIKRILSLVKTISTTSFAFIFFNLNSNTN